MLKLLQIVNPDMVNPAIPEEEYAEFQKVRKWINAEQLKNNDSDKSSGIAFGGPG